MPDDNSNAILGAIVGLLVIAVVGIGGFLFLDQKPAPATPAISVSLSGHSPAPSSPNR